VFEEMTTQRSNWDTGNRFWVDIVYQCVDIEGGLLFNTEWNVFCERSLASHYENINPLLAIMCGE
jgi:hypothetical protein